MKANLPLKGILRSSQNSISVLVKFAPTQTWFSAKMQRKTCWRLMGPHRPLRIDGTGDGPYQKFIINVQIRHYSSPSKFPGSAVPSQVMRQSDLPLQKRSVTVYCRLALALGSDYTIHRSGVRIDHFSTSPLKPILRRRLSSGEGQDQYLRSTDIVGTPTVPHTTPTLMSASP
jgi:hypothetical protein